MKDKIIFLANKPWMHFVWLALITSFAAALRFYKLGDWSFWIDEIYTVNHATAHFSTIQLILDNIPPNRNWVPISVILTAQALNFWGVSEWSARFTSTMIGILSIPVLFFPTRKIFGNWIALIAVLLLAVSPWHLFWSQNARFYTSLMLLYTLALFVIYIVLEENKPRYFILFYALLYLAFSERLFAFFIFPVIGGYLILLWVLRFDKPDGMNFRNIFLVSLPILVGFIIEIYSWLASDSSRFFADFNWFFLYRNDDPFRLVGNISFNIGIPLMVLALFSCIFLIRQKSRAGLLLTVNAMVPPIMLVVANPFIFTKERYIFLILFSWILLAAIAVNKIFNHVSDPYRWLVIGVLFVLVADAGGSALLYYRVNHGNRGEWETAFTIIQERSKSDDIVVTYWPELGLYYLDREFIHYEDIDVPTILNSGKRYWFVIDAETIWANPEVISFLENDARLIDIRYLRLPDDFFLRIYFFNPEQHLLY